MNRYLPIAVFTAAVLVGLGMTYSVYLSVMRAEKSRFEIAADEAADRIQERVNLHVALLLATRSLFVATEGVPTRTVFRDYISGLDLNGRFEGVQGIGFAQMVPTGDMAAIEARILRDYDVNARVRPDTEQSLRTPIVLLEPFDHRNRNAIGYDMFSETSRRMAMQRAMNTDTPQASGPVELVQEITSDKQAGFLVYLSISETELQGRQTVGPDTGIEGFVYAPFRVGDLHEAALSRLPSPAVIVETLDTTEQESKLLYRSPDFDAVATNNLFLVERQLEIAGREWTVSVRERPEFRAQVSFLSVYLLGAISLFFSAALAVSTRAQLKAIESAQRLNAVSEKAVAEKDLLLQEMKHRIKNSLSKVLAIARQTASGSESLSAFTESFSARMRAMADAQEMLTRSEWRKGNLGELLRNELLQVYGERLGPNQLAGPDVPLDEQSIQALGLTFHELATNAMKYGALSRDDGELRVRWSVDGQGKNKQLTIDWIEIVPGGTAKPTTRGFGSRLIDMNIKGELGGTIVREFNSGGMSIQIKLPLNRNYR